MWKSKNKNENLEILKNKNPNKNENPKFRKPENSKIGNNNELIITITNY